MENNDLESTNKKRNGEDEMLYSCPKCEYSGSESEVKYHLKYRHKGRYPCDHCEYAGIK